MPAKVVERSCGVIEVEERIERRHRNYRENRDKIEYHAAAQYLRRGAKAAAPKVVTIPVVVHVVYRTAAENISDAQIRSQMAVLNRDYRKLNGDVNRVPAGFKLLVADARVQFKLATVDPKGNATTGITRTKSATRQFPDDDSVKYRTRGGENPWPWSCYLNIWVCNLVPWLGYATFPGSPARVDGVVIGYKWFGTTGAATAPFNKGRTATHEVGHWLNLRHIWGDDPACDASDGVADTPNQADKNYGCPAYPHISCGNGPRGDMFMNYMDYTDDACMFMFSQGQVERMWAALAGPRKNIVNCGASRLRSAPAKKATKKVTKTRRKTAKRRR